MESIVVLAFVAALLSTGGVYAMPDPCIPGNYMEINDAHRSVNYHTLDSESGICDMELNPGWYRFTSSSGGALPEHCVQREMCGTIAPVWMQGTHPTVSDGIVGRKVCVNTNRAGNCCDRSLDIGVKTCPQGYYVYYLKPTDACPMAYCAGDAHVCPGGKWSASGVAPCVDVYPIITTHPTLSYPEVVGNTFRYRCTINHLEYDPDLMFEVEWTFDGQTDLNAAPDTTISGATYAQKYAFLPGYALHGHMGQEVGCRIRGWYKNRPVVQKSEWRNSTESRLAAIYADRQHVVVDEKGGVQTVKLISTVPIVCDTGLTSSCCIYLSVDINGPRDNAVIAHPCKFKLCSTDWDPITHTASTDVTMSAYKDQIDDGNQNMVLEFETIKSAGLGSYADAFTDYRTENIRITSVDGKTSTCKWESDPHYTGFNGQVFHLFEVGDFTVYENLQDNFEVISRLKLCNPDTGAACQCGLVIREHNDLIKIDGCPDLNHAPVVTTNHQPREGTVIERSTDGHHIMVYLPSGREVKVDSAAWLGKEHAFQNVYLTVPASDLGHGRGICGTLDDRTDNEFTHRNGTVEPRSHACPNDDHCFPVEFAQSWRNDSTTSLFENQPVSLNFNENEPHYCQCDNTTSASMVNCSVAADKKRLQRCGGNPCLDQTNNFSFMTNNGWAPNGKRSVANLYVDVDEADPPVDLSPVPESLKIRKRDARWPTASGITETQARSRCESELQAAQLNAHCPKGTAVFDNCLTNCIMDILYLDSYDMLHNSLSAFTASCQLSKLTDPASYNTVNGKLVLNPEIADVCSISCFRHGTCVRGRCVCNAGFAGNNCQLLADQPPILKRIRGAPECDINQQPCQKVFLEAENFEMGHTFACRIIHTLDDGSTSQDFIDNPAEFISGNRLACPLPAVNVTTENSVKTWSVQVSTDSKLFSNAILFTVYDSTCRMCSGHYCTQKPGTCLIQNVCHQDGDINPTDNTQVCRASQSSKSWSTAAGQGTYPDMGYPDMGIPAVTLATGHTDIMCAVQSYTDDPQARFEVVWVFNGQEEKGPVLAGDQRVATHLDLPERPLTVQCKVRSFFSGGSVFSPFMISHTHVARV